jgi:3'(2'), 5'-bisphosphate nucleotidase
MQYDAELKQALRAAELATARILELYEGFVAIPDARADITTRADKEAQEIILQTLRERFPADAYCAEEQTPTLAACAREGPRTWVIDPIDGTRGFAQKNGEFSVMIALAAGGASIVGVVQEPVADRVTYAVRGRGCWRREKGGEPVECRVTKETDLARATLTQSRSRSGQPSKQAVALGVPHVHETHSAGVKLARVARGDADLYVNHYPNFHDWDICAGHVLVEEAGGKVAGLRGEEVRYGRAGASQRLGLLASNGLLHDAALARLREVF